ncbi:MAG TPA: hypothetical protein VK179_00750, partial [Bacteroidales bacterium]|nr:hypothetical protein [Bacteroidales bacterium]
MSKFYFIIFAFLLVTFKAVSQDTLNLVQPSNLQAFLQDNIVQLSWQAPVDTTTSNDTIPPGLSGYRIYCNNVLIG